MAYKHVGYRGSGLFLTDTLSNNDSLEFLAKELKRGRLEKKLSVDDVSQLTRIKKQYLEQLEDGNFGFLPNTYVYAFAKAYIRAMELDCNEILEQCKKDLQLHSALNKNEIIETGSGHNEKNSLSKINIYKSELMKSILPLTIGMFVGVLIGVCSSYNDQSTNVSTPRPRVLTARPSVTTADTSAIIKHRSKRLVTSSLPAKPSPAGRPHSSVSAIAPAPLAQPVSGTQHEATTIMRLLPDTVR